MSEIYYDVDGNIRNGSNKIEIVVTDNVGNESRLESTVFSD